jgi:hypothetical protein
VHRQAKRLCPRHALPGKPRRALSDRVVDSDEDIIGSDRAHGLARPALDEPIGKDSGLALVLRIGEAEHPGDFAPVLDVRLKMLRNVAPKQDGVGVVGVVGGLAAGSDFGKLARDHDIGAASTLVVDPRSE